jgi:hypothetical protein
MLRSRTENRSKSVVARLRRAGQAHGRRSAPLAIADLVGSVDGLPADLSGRKKAHPKATGYGRKHSD